MADSKAFKQFFTSRSSLDSLRMHLNITEDFLVQMRESGVINDDQLDLLKCLNFPANRNELMQILIKKKWNNDGFGNFCTALKDTQESALGTNFVQQAETFVKTSEKERAQEEKENYHSIYPSSEMEGLGLQQQTAIMFKLKTKDDTIRKLTEENESMKETLETLTQDHDDIKRKYTLLDKAVQEMLAGLGSNDDEDSISEAVNSLTSVVHAERKRLAELDIDCKRFRAELAKQELEHKEMKIEHSEMKRKLNNVNILLERERTLSKNKLEEMTNSLTATRTRNNQAQRKLDSLQGMFGENIRELQRDLTKTKNELNEKTKALEGINFDRDRIKNEMKLVKERTRKLLFTLGLTNDIGNTGQALEHARNITYAMRRRNSSTEHRAENQLQSADSMAAGAESLVPMVEMLESLNGTPVRDGYEVGQSRVFSSRGSRQVSARRINNTLSPRPNSRANGVLLTVPAQSHALTSRPTTANLLSVPENSRSPMGSPRQNKDLASLDCAQCGRTYSEPSNHDNACSYHPAGAVKMFEGTAMEVWSCCKSVDIKKGCIKARHCAK